MWIGRFFSNMGVGEPNSLELRIVFDVALGCVFCRTRVSFEGVLWVRDYNLERGDRVASG